MAKHKTLRKISIAAALVLVLLVLSNWLTFVVVVGTSMEPALSDGEIMPAIKLSAGDTIVKGDVYLIEWEDREIIKRILAGPGDTVDGIDGAIYVNGELKVPAGGTRWDTFRIVIPPDCYFALGDNFDESVDSRMFKPDAIHRKEIAARICQ